MSAFGGFGQQQQPSSSSFSSGFGFAGGGAGFGQQQQQQQQINFSSFSSFGGQQQSVGQFGFGQTTAMLNPQMQQQQQQQLFGGGIPSSSTTTTTTTISPSPPSMPMSGDTYSSTVFGKSIFGGGGFGGSSSSSSGGGGSGRTSVGVTGDTGFTRFGNSSNSFSQPPPPASSSTAFAGFGGSGGVGNGGGSSIQSSSFSQPQWQQQQQPTLSEFSTSPATTPGFGTSSISAATTNSSGFGSIATLTNNTNYLGLGGLSGAEHTTSPMPISSFSSSTMAPSSSSNIVFGSSSTVAATISNFTPTTTATTGFATAGFAPASTSSQQLNADATPFYSRSQDPSVRMAFSDSGGFGTSTSMFPAAADGGGGGGFGTSTSTEIGTTGFGGAGVTGSGGNGAFGGSSVATTFSPLGSSSPPPSSSDDVAAIPSTSFVDRRIPRKTRRSDDINVASDSATAGGDTVATTPTTSGGEEQLSALRAKIREKREKLQKLKFGEQTTQKQSNRDGRKSLAATVLSTTRDDNVAQGDTNADLAARNALRFSTSSSDRDQTLSRLMPADLKGRGGIGSTEWSTPARSDVDDNEDDNNTDIDDEDADVDDDDDLGLRNLSNAKSLVGTCLSMCPDEELIRREKEGDIQLLEVTDPGGLHPKEWTLRDTAVKRFRRSAADFKLDIPELIRPPNVLERVCGYLEEWVMERDRQGPDTRWAQQPSNTPPPLDVYQFIWDRTRMVRKDFILQNYIGTGGKCDARAVRCHERIARWHAMCEHQLSHIPEFVAHQSQQNIAELGQTMKTLNNYYDDASGRSLIEVENSEGTVDSTQSVNGAQGCVSDIVMGKSPIDFDGRSLNNSATSLDISMRIIGGNGINSPTLGTAEPEMRGLYILLTLNNEGGMEVLKYSGRLCSQKPDVFYSKPVQLALSIFQAKKEQNYARFFSLMRSPSTPYLFACIMFKYVESMRKEALIIMSRTYGAKHKTTGQPFYDSYPIENLVKLLCYEDEEEARTACQHYGITVKGDQVLWRHGRFVEPRDPEKGHIIPLKPRKMIRTIESKLNGATRLSVCRGGVSGDGATLSITSRNHDTLSHFDRKQAQEADEKTRADEMQLQIEIEAKARAERQKIERDRIRQEELVAEKRARAEAAKRAALERAQSEKLLREQLMAEQKRKELEACRAAEEKAAAERAERERQERERTEQEMARIRAEEEERERERQMLIEKEREEEARRLADTQAAKERAEKEHRAREESRRLAELRRQAEEERIRKAKEEEALRIELMWIEKIEQARKLLVWRLWRKQMLNYENQQQSRLCLENLDPTTTHYPAPIAGATPVPNTSHNKVNSAREFNLESQIYRLATAPREPINLARMAALCKPLFSIPDTAFPPNLQSSSNVIFFKLIVILPKRIREIGNLYDSMLMWVNSRLRPGCISCYTFTRRSVHYEIRAVAVIGNEDSTGFTDCNAALVLLPSDAGKSQIEYPKAAEDLLASSIPRIVLVLDGEQYMGSTSYIESILKHLVGPSNDREGVVSPEMCHLESAFEQCCEAVVESHVKSLREDCPSMVRVSLANFGFLCLQRLFQNMDVEGIFRSNYPIDSFFCFVKEVLTMLVTEVTNASNEIHETKQNWPPHEFFDKVTESIPAIFNGQYDLPSYWHTPFSDVDLKVQLFDIFQDLMVKESFINAVHILGNVLAPDLQQQLLSMIDKDDIVRCFISVVSIIVNGELRVETREETILYLPAETISSIVERVGSFEAPSEPAPMPTDIPEYLFNHVSYPIYDDEEANYSEDEYAEEAIERNYNKRKPRTSDRETPVSERIKRIRSQEPLSMETVEQKRSKEFTSYLEALLNSGET